MKRVFIIHGWDGIPNDSWKSWLKRELEKRGFEVIAPQIPGGRHPKLQEWIETISNSVVSPDVETYFVGHSLGCIAIVRYLATLSANVRVGGCVFVSGFSSDLGVSQIAEFYSSPSEVKKATAHTNNFVIIHSDDDEDVPMEKAKEFQKQLNARFILEHNKGHISEDDGVKELPSALNAIIEISR